MADKKVSELSAITNLSGDDLLLVVNDPTGTPTSKKVTVDNLFANVVSDTTHKGIVTHNANTVFVGNKMTVGANATFSGTLTVSGSLVQSGSIERNGVQIQNANLIVNAVTTANGTLKLEGSLVTDSGVIIGTNGRIHANNSIENGTITYDMVNFVDDYLEVANAVPLIESTITTQSNIDSIHFDTTAGVSVGEAQIAWNDSDGTFNVGMKNGDATLQMGQEEYVYATNVGNTAIENGQVVYFSTSIGGRVGVEKFSANGIISRTQQIGLATQQFEANTQGYITTFGYVRGVDTRGNVANTITVGDESWANGTILYAHPTVPGKMSNAFTGNTTAKVLQTAVVIDSNIDGTVFVKRRVLNTLSDLIDVDMSPDLNTGDILSYNGITQKFDVQRNAIDVRDDPATSNAITEIFSPGDIFVSNTKFYVCTNTNTIKHVDLYIDEPIHATFNINNNGTTAYVFTGAGTANTDNETLYLYKGFTYRFVNTTGASHPFQILNSAGGSAFANGVSGSQTGTQLFTVPHAQQANLVYQCSIHSGMQGTLVIVS